MKHQFEILEFAFQEDNNCCIEVINNNFVPGDGANKRLTIVIMDERDCLFSGSTLDERRIEYGELLESRVTEP